MPSLHPSPCTQHLHMPVNHDLVAQRHPRQQQPRLPQCFPSAPMSTALPRNKGLGIPAHQGFTILQEIRRQWRR